MQSHLHFFSDKSNHIFLHCCQNAEPTCRSGSVIWSSGLDTSAVLFKLIPAVDSVTLVRCEPGKVQMLHYAAKFGSLKDSVHPLGPFPSALCDSYGTGQKQKQTIQQKQGFSQ